MMREREERKMIKKNLTLVLVHVKFDMKRLNVKSTSALANRLEMISQSFVTVFAEMTKMANRLEMLLD